MDEFAPVTQTAPMQPAERPLGLMATLSRNVALSLARVAINTLVALILPAYLTHHLPVTTYGAWVLILQLGAIVSFLDFGVQTGVAKFVAEYDAKGDRTGAGHYASAGFAFLIFTGLLGVGLTLILAWQVPRLFHNMPISLYSDVRTSIILVGISLSFGLVCSIFSAVFLGLQRYAAPMGLAIVNRILFTVAILATVFLHGSLAEMGAVVALVNIFTSLLQVIAWRRTASHIRISLSLVDAHILKRMMRYCGLLAVWTAGMLCVNGLDVTIVGHYDYARTAYYSIATMPTNFLLLIISSMLGPMMPASSALSTHRSPKEMGEILGRTTRYSTIILLLTGLPLMIYGLPILKLWVGETYAIHSIRYLQILVLANIVRNLCAPYATMIAATGKLGAATVAPILEAVVNLSSSLYLASRYGAIGVAFGTLLGSFTSVSLHFAISMRFSRKALLIPRMRLFLVGFLRPAIISAPSVFLLSPWGASWLTSERIPIAIFWGIGTLSLAWFYGLDREEQDKLKYVIKNSRAALVSQSKEKIVKM